MLSWPMQYGVLPRLRAICLALPETSERTAWGHPTFRAGRKMFAVFERVRGRPSIAIRLPAPQVKRLLRGKGFFAPPYGRGIWVSLWTDAPINWLQVERLLHRGYREVALKRMIAALDAICSD